MKILVFSPPAGSSLLECILIVGVRGRAPAGASQWKWLCCSIMLLVMDTRNGNWLNIMLIIAAKFPMST